MRTCCLSRDYANPAGGVNFVTLFGVQGLSRYVGSQKVWLYKNSSTQTFRQSLSNLVTQPLLLSNTLQEEGNKRAGFFSHTKNGPLVNAVRKCPYNVEASWQIAVTVFMINIFIGAIGRRLRQNTKQTGLLFNIQSGGVPQPFHLPPTCLTPVEMFPKQLITGR